MTVNGYVCVQSWMVNGLELKGHELMTYAIIYGFSQDGESWFTGTRSYIADWCGVSKVTVSRDLSSLCEKGLLQRREKIVNGMTFNDYRAVLSIANACSTSDKMTIPPTHSDNTHYQSDNTPLLTVITHKAKEDNLKEKTKENVKRKPRKQFVPPTLEEVEAYAQSRNSSVDPKRFFDYFAAGDWHDSKGNQVRNWKQKLITWESKSNGGYQQQKKEVEIDEQYKGLF